MIMSLNNRDIDAFLNASSPGKPFHDAASGTDRTPEAASAPRSSEPRVIKMASANDGTPGLARK